MTCLGPEQIGYRAMNGATGNRQTGGRQIRYWFQFQPVTVGPVQALAPDVLEFPMGRAKLQDAD